MTPHRSRPAIPVLFIVLLVSVASLAQGAAPDPPAGVSVVDVRPDAGTQLKITITKSPSDVGGGVTNYLVWRKTASTSYVQIRDIPATGAATYQFVDTGLTRGVAYCYGVRALKTGVASTMVTCWGRPVDDSAHKPLPVSNLRVLDAPGDLGTAVWVKWAKSPDDPIYVYRYLLYRKTDSTSWVQIATVAADDLAEYTYTDNTITPNVLYRYGVRAQAGCGQVSDLVSASGQGWDNTPRTPGPPRNPSAADNPADTGTALLVRWQASVDDPGIVSHYQMWRRQGTSGPFVQIGGNIVATGAASYEYKDTGLTPGQLYQYMLRAAAGWNLSDPVTTSGRPINNTPITPDPVTNLRVEDYPNDNGTKLLVKWGKSTHDPVYVTRYDIYRKTGSEAFTLLANITPDGSTEYVYTDSPVTPGVVYTYGLRAIAGATPSALVQASGSAFDNTPRAPADPSNIRAQDVPADDGTQLDVMWTRSADDPGIVTKYTVYEWNGTTFVPIADVPVAKAVGDYTYRRGGLTAGQPYKYAVRAWAGTYPSGLVKMTSYVRPINNNPPTPVLPPASITVTDTGTGDALRVSFAKSPHDPVYVTRYDVYKRVGSGSWSLYSQIAADDKPNYGFTDTGLIGGTTYYYGVRAVAPPKQSDMLVGSGSPKDLFPPGPPTLAAADVPNDNGNAIALTLGRSADDGAGRNDVKSYKVERRVAGAATWDPLTTITANGSATYNYTDSTCTPGTTYNYQARAYDGTNYSTPATATATAEDNLPPRPPAGVTVSDVPADDGDALNILIRKSPDDGGGANDVKLYEIWCAPPGQALGLVKTITATGAATYSWNHTGLTPGVLYSYAVRALDSGRASSSVAASGTPVDNTAPRPPTSLVAVDNPGDATGTVLITFNKSPDDDAVGEVTAYELWQKPDGGTYAAVSPTIPATKAASYSVTRGGLTLGARYWFKVRAIGTTGNSVFSNEDDATPVDDTPPAPPAGIDAHDRPYDDGGVVEVVVSKSPDDGGGKNTVKTYRIYRKRATVVEDPTLIATITATGAATYTYLDTGLTGFILYSYTAKAVTAVGAESTAAGPDLAVAENNNSLVADWDPPGSLTAIDRPGDTGGVIQLQWYRTSAEDDGGEPPPPPLGGVEARGDGYGQYDFQRRVVGTAWPTGAPTFYVSDAGTNDPMLYLDRGLTNGTTYEYRCRYRRGNRVSPWSNTASASPKNG